MRNFSTINPLKRAFFACLLLTMVLISAYAVQGPPPGHGGMKPLRPDRHKPKPDSSMMDNHDRPGFKRDSTCRDSIFRDSTHRDSTFRDSARHHRHIKNKRDSISHKNDSTHWGDVTIELENDRDSILMDSDFVCEGNLHLKRGVLKLNHHKLRIKGNCTADSGSIDCDSTSSIEINGNDSIVRLRFAHGRKHLGKLKIHDCDTTIIEGDIVVTDSVEVLGGILDISAASFGVRGPMTMFKSRFAGDRRTKFTWSCKTKPDTLNFARGKDTLGTFTMDHSRFLLTVGSNLRIADSLCLNNGKMQIRDGILSLDSNCVMKGFNRNSYIITGDSGSLQRHVRGNGREMEFPIGNAHQYAPAFITPVRGSDTCQYRVHVAYGVLINGLTGDSLHNRPMVKNTWHVTCTADSFKLDLKVKWPKGLETPDFNPKKCFISHYEHHCWDSIPPTVADTLTDSTLIALTRTGIQSLSPFTVMSPNAPTSIAVNQVPNNVIVYPNPATEFVTFASTATGSVIIADLTGRIQRNVVLSGESSTVNVGDMPAGLYLYKLISNGKVTATGKLAVRK